MILCIWPEKNGHIKGVVSRLDDNYTDLIHIMLKHRVTDEGEMLKCAVTEAGHHCITISDVSKFVQIYLLFTPGRKECPSSRSMSNTVHVDYIRKVIGITYVVSRY